MSKTNKKNTKSKLIPELRFPEFQDKPQWEEVSFRDYIRLYRGSSPRPIKNYLTQDDEGVNWIKIADASNSNNKIINKVAEKITKSGALHSRKVTKGELILANSMSYGSVYELAVDGYIHDGWFVLREYEEDYNRDFLRFMLNSDFVQKQYRQTSAGGVVLNISSDIVYSTRLFLTSKAEQERIGEFFYVLDSLIQAQSKEVQLLRLRKKGLMQKLFPYEGETTPEWRFPEFKDAPQWEVKTIEEIGTIVTGNTPSKKNDNYWGGDFVWVTAEDMKSKYVSNSVNKLTELGKSKARVIPKNSVLVTCIASIGLNCINKVACATNQQINAIICNEQYCNEFVFYSISNIENLLKNYSGQTAVPIINKGDFQLLSLPLPSLAEQERIASVFSTLDALIEAKSQRLEQLKKHKKGLMQQLFP